MSEKFFNDRVLDTEQEHPTVLKSVKKVELQRDLERKFLQLADDVAEASEQVPELRSLHEDLKEVLNAGKAPVVGG